jgi:hypothetical protein
MNTLILCTAVTLNIFSAPAGNQVVGTVPANKEVQLMDGSCCATGCSSASSDPMVLVPAVG